MVEYSTSLMMKKLKAYLYFGGIFLSAIGAIYYFSLLDPNVKELSEEDCIKPANLQVDTNATDDGWVITWEDPIEGPPERYRISYERQSNPGSFVFVQNVFPEAGSVQSPYTVLLTESSPGFPVPGQYYKVHVSYVGDSFTCGLNALPTSNGVNKGWQPFPGADCELPSGLHVTPMERAISIGWTSPPSVEHVNHYLLKVDGETWGTIPNTINSASILGRTPGQTYSIELCIECELPGQIPTTECLRDTTVTTIGCPAPNLASVSFSNILPTAFTVNWPSANLQTETYRVYYSQEGIDDYSNYNDETNNTSTTFSGLSVGTNYQVKVCSTCGDSGDTSNCTDWKLVSTIAGCEPPINAVASDIRETQFNLSWDPPAQNQYLQSYRIYSNSVLAQTLGNNITNHTLNGLNENTSYDIQICSYCDVPGQGTTESCVDLGTISTSACPAPSSITHSSITSSSYRVSWPTAGLQTETYRAYHRLPNNPGSTITKDDVNSPFAVTFDGLDPETTYETRICATCGDFSSQNNCTAWQLVNTLAEPGVCDPPNHAIVEAGADQSSCPSEPVTLTASPSNGQSPYTYLWSSGDAAISTTVSPTETSTYYVTMTDNNGCEAVDSVNVNMIDLPSFSFTVNPADCGGMGSASVSGISGGTGPFSFQWRHGSASSSTGNVSPGVYVVTVTDDASGCVAVDSVTVDGHPEVTVDAGEDRWICFETSMISLSAAPGGGTAPYTYEWNVFGDNTQQTITTSPPSFGKTYSVTITDANGCTAIDEVEVNRYSQTIVNISETPTSCGLNNGALSVSPLGGEGPYEIHWSTGSLNSSITNLGPGTYAVTVTDKNGCDYIETASVAASTGVTADLGTDLSICAGQLVTLDPSASGVGNLNYSWSTGETTSSIEVNPTSSIPYSVTVTDQNGCTATDQINVTVFSSPDIQLSKSDASCGEDNGTVNTQINGGTPPYITTWSNGASTTNLTNLGVGTYTLTLIDANGCTAQASISLTATAAASLALGNDVSICNGESYTISPVASGNGAINYAWENGHTGPSLTVSPTATTDYPLTITDAEGCQANDTITVVVHDAPALVFTTVNASCGLANGSITANPSGGTAPYTYNWSNGAGNVDQLTDLGEGTYALTLTDDNGCFIIQSTTLSNSTGATVDAGSDQTICIGESIAISAPGTGSAPYNYSWSGPNINGSGATITVSPTSTATYSVTLTADNGCTATDEVTIYVEAPPVVDLGADIILCEGESTILDASTSGASSYYWSTGATSSSINVNPTADSTYSVTITGSNGCESSDEIYVEVSTVPSFTFTPTNESCGQQNGDIAVNIAAGSYTYNWSNGATSQNISSIAAGTYTVTITNAEGCTATGTTSITNQNEADIELGNDSTICVGVSIDLSPLINTGTGPYTYSWEGGETSAILTVTPTVPTTYYVTVTDNGGCSAEDSIHIDVNEVPIVNIGPDQSICPGTIVTLGGNPVGPDGATYFWSSGPSGIIGAGESGQITLSPESSTTLSLAITGTNGCSATDLVTVTVTDGLQLTAQAIEGSCTDTLGSAFVQVNGGLSPYTYEWSNGATSDTILDLNPGTYDVTVTSADGCFETASIQVETGSGLQLSFLPTAESTNGAADGSATVQVSGGVPPYSYQWDYNNATTPTINNLPSNIYQVTVTDSGGCSSTGSVTIIVADGSDGNPLCGTFSVEATVTEAACSNEGKGSISLVTSNAQAPIQYHWSTGDTTASIGELDAGSYHYTVVDANGCSIIDSAQIQPHSLVFTPVDTTICQIVDYIQAIPMAGNQILVKVEGLNQSSFDNMTQSSSIGAIDIFIDYQGLSGPRTESVNLYQQGGNTNINAWSWVVFDVMYETSMQFSVLMQQGGNCPASCESTSLRYLETVQDSVEAIIQEDPPIELVGYECGEEFTASSNSNQVPLSTASTADLFYIYDFPVLLTSVSGANGSFSGTGIIPLPFNKQTVKVEFTNVSVNNDYHIWQGEVAAVADAPSNYGNMPDTILFGSPEICVQTPEPTNAYGFDEDGIHTVTGTMYDENGFDVNGNHKDTQGPYNLDGCNRDGRDRDDQPCSLKKASPAVEAFLDTMQAGIPTLATNILDQKKQDLETALAAQTQVCSGIRDTMNQLMTVLEYDREFIFGEGDIYFNKGMHLAFAEKPKQMTVGDINRDPNTVLLEENHVRLYTCDEAEYELEELIAQIEEALGADGMAELEVYIIDRLAEESDAKVNTFNDPVIYNDWLVKVIQDFLEREPGEEIGYLIEPPIQNYNSPKMQFNQYETLAANSEIDLGGISEREQIIRELDFQFKQGFKYINGVHRAFFLEEIGKAQSLVNNENGENLLPICVSKQIGGYKYTIHLDKIIFTPTGATLDAFLILEDPRNAGRKLVFEVINAGFGPAGLNTGSTLELVSETEITLSNSARLILKGGGRNYVDWDCTGFLGMHLDAEVELCREFITPLHPVSLEPLPDTTLYRLKFEAYIFEWLDLVVGVDADPFAVTGTEDIKWEMDSMYIDLSDKFTPAIEPPDGYASPYLTPHGMSPMWRGFYMRELSATLPNQFSSGNESLTVGVEDVVIDGCGFSGDVFVENLLSIADGNAGGWPFSIDKFGLKILHNHLAGAEFGGDINVPIFEDNMRYEAAIFPNNKYKLTVQPNEKETVNVFLAEAVIYPNSKVELQLDQGEFTALATLSGDLKFQVPDSMDLQLNLPELRFCNLRLSNKNPYFDAGVWEISNLELGMKMGGFGININNIRPYQSDSPTEAGLNFNLDLEISKGLQIFAGGGFGIVGELEEINNRQKWKFKKIQVHEFYVDADIKDQVHIQGSLTHFENHATFGEGFSGLLSANFKQLGFRADAAGLFGQIDTSDYFFVDVLVDAGLGLNAGPVSIDGFGGGISYHMENNFNAASINFGNAVGAITSAPPIGVSFSGVQYTPNNTIGLGIKATTLISTLGNKNLFNGSVSLEVLFNSPEFGGGLREIGMKGNGHFLTPPDNAIPPAFQKLPNAPPPRTAIMSAFIDMKLRFDTLSLSGDLAVYLNALGILRGAGTNNSLCKASVYFSPNDWYINIGTPTDRCGALLDIPLLGEIRATSYFNVGTSIPDFPELPDNVRSIANRIQSNEGLRKSGGGFMFGASLDVEYNLNAGPVKGFLNAGLGFDVMLRDYGNAICAESGQRVGLDGWYAAGQMWGYLEGGVKLFGVKILEAGLAAVLQARLPNPFWAKATVAARVKVLFVQRRFNVGIEIGRLCTLASDDPNDLIGMDLITFTNPGDGAIENQTDVRPEVHFAVPINKVFQVPDEQGNPANFTASIKTYTLYSQQWGTTLEADIEMFNNNSAVRLVPDRILPANDSLTATIIIEILKNGEFFAEEEQSFSFTTGEAFDHIPESNIAHSYPANGMYEFFKEEYVDRQGFIQLVSGQPDLFYNEEVETRIKLEAANGTAEYLDLTYDGISRKIVFDLPPSSLIGDELYKMTVVQQDPTEGDQLISQPIYFRVSPYNKFRDKANAITAASNVGGGLLLEAGPPIAKDLDALDPFGELSLSGSDNIDPLVTFQAKVQDDTWYNSEIKPLIYDQFPVAVSVCGGGKIGFVDEGSGFGLPEDAAGIESNGLSLIQVKASDFEAGAMSFRSPAQKLVYSVPNQALEHYHTLQLQIANCVQLIIDNLEDQITIEQEGGSEDEGGGNNQGNGNDDGTTESPEEQAAKDLLPASMWEIYEGLFPSAPPGQYIIEAFYRLPNGQLTWRHEILIDTNSTN